MFASIKAEFRKLLTVRSTYIITLLAFLLATFFTFYVQGYRADAGALMQRGYLSEQITSAITSMAIFGALVGVLLMAHEYRYSTIMYTLTSSNSRLKTLFAKVFTVTVFALFYSVIICAWAPIATAIGMHVHHLHAVHQVIPYADIAWRVLLYGWGTSMIGLLLVVLTRNLTASIASLFLIPGTVELLLGLLLKKNAVYLPFSSLQAVVEHNDKLSYGHAALVFGTWIVGGWVIGLILFLKRDAN